MAQLLRNRMLAILMVFMVAVAFTPVFMASQQASAATNKLYSTNTSITVYVGSTAKVGVTGPSKKNLKKVKWSTSNSSVASISTKKGSSTKVTGKSAGKATVTAKWGKKSKKFSISVKEVVTKDNTVTGTAKGDTYVSGVIYQESAEVAAQYKQVFQLARLRLDEAIADNEGTGEGLAIVTDIDATLMDDSTYIAGALLDSEGRAALGSDPWDNDDWNGYYQAVASTADDAVPGAVDFINYAYSKGVEIYYITNRPYYELDLTVQQLKQGGFNVDSIINDYAELTDESKRLQEYHYWAGGEGDDYNKEVLDYQKEVIDSSNYEMTAGSFSLKGDYRVQVQGSDFSSDKAVRRANVASVVEENGGKIIMYMGDSINDMISKNEYKSNTSRGYTQDESIQFDRSQGNAARTEAVMNDTWKDKWGTEFIVMPNSAYGDWQKATWDKKSISSDEQIEAMRTQLWNHSYLNTDKFSTWYNGTSPITPDVQ